MGAVVLRGPGRPEVIDVPDPTPGPDEVIVAVDACGICGTDIHVYEGEFSPTPYPIVPGHEFCGEVAEAGERTGIPEGLFAAIRLPLESCEDAIAQVRAADGLKVQLTPNSGPAR